MISEVFEVSVCDDHAGEFSQTEQEEHRSAATIRAILII
jgi:hypothetical protein